MADIKWIKLSTGLPDNRKVKRIRKLPDGNNVILFWVFILARAGEANQKGGLYITDTLPYSNEDLAADFDFTVEFVKFAIIILEKYGMLTTYDGVLFIKNWEEYQSADSMERLKEQNRIRQQNFRDKQKRLSQSNVTSNVTHNTEITPSNAIELELELDKEIDKDKRLKDMPVADALATSPQSKPKNVKQVKHKHGEYDNVLLTDKEYQTLKAELGDDLNYWIEKVSGYMAGNGNKNHYKNFLAVIRNWSKNGKDNARQQYQYKNSRPSPKLPDWVDKDIPETEMSAEEKEKIEARINRLKESRDD